VASDIRSRLKDFPIFEEVVTCFDAELAKATDALVPFSELPPVPAMQKIAQLVRAQLQSIA
jgi:hypothetical protein